MPRIAACAVMAVTLAAGAALAHGDVAPQPVDTSALPDIGEEWLTENPYRAMEPAVFAKAVEIGASGYNQNCARCHGLQVVSGGLAPDLRYLEADEMGDEWFAERFVSGYTQNGITKMPAFGELLGQKAAWAIRSYIETRPDDESLAEQTPRLTAIMQELGAMAAKGDADPAAIAALREELAAIGAKIKTYSGAEAADSPASRAAAALAAAPESLTAAAEILTVGLSKAE